MRTRPRQSIDGVRGPYKALSATNRSAIETVLSIDREMAGSLRTAISETAEMLSVICKLRKYRDRTLAPVERNDSVVVA